MTLPIPGNVSPGNVPVRADSLESLFAAILARLSEDQRKTLYSAVISSGGLRVQGGGAFQVALDDGVRTFYTGPLISGGVTDYQGVQMRRADGTAIFSTFPVGGDPDLIAWAFFDHLGNEVLSSDAQVGGLARPWIPVPLEPRISMAAGTFDYYNIAASASERTMWEGRIVLVSHPRIEVDGVWGQASGTNTTTYRLKVAGTEIGSWTVGGGLVVNRRGPFDVSPWQNNSFVAVTLTAASSGTGQVACSINGCGLRQS